MKARFKAMTLAALGTLSVFSAITYTSCERDKCKTIVCAYGGVCTDGACNCVAGYEGPQCETVNRERFLNDWIVSEDGSITDADQYNVTVLPAPNIQQVYIRNFNNVLTDYVSAFVQGDTITINQQVVNGYTVTGRGYVLDEKYKGVHGKLLLKYKITNNKGQTNDFGFEGSNAPSLWNK